MIFMATDDNETEKKGNRAYLYFNIVSRRTEITARVSDVYTYYYTYDYMILVLYLYTVSF